MPSDSLNDLIAEILDSGEPVDFESLLIWPKPVDDTENFQSARSALKAFDFAKTNWKSRVLEPDAPSADTADSFAPATSTYQSERRVARHHTAGSPQPHKDTSQASNDTSKLLRWFWSLKSGTPSNRLPQIPLVDDELKLERELSPDEWCLAESYVKHFAEPIERCAAVQSPIDWRPGIRPECYSDDASFFYNSYNVVKVLSLAAILHSIKRGISGWAPYLTSGAQIGSASASIRLLMSHVVHVGCAQRFIDTVTYVLNRVPVSKEALTQLLSAFEVLDDDRILEGAYVGERVFALADFRKRLSEDQQANNWWLWLDKRTQIELQYYLENMAKLIAIARLPLQDRFCAWFDYVQEPARRPKSKELHKAINEDAKCALPLNLVMLTRLRLLRTALIALRDGPRSLANEELLPQDPFNPDGAPLRFRHCGERFFAYSVGVNQVDDEGSAEQLDEYGPLWGLVQHRLLTKDILLVGTPRTNGTVSLEWPWNIVA